MYTIDIQRAWRDGEYFLSLTDEQRSMVPNSPAGAIQIASGEVETITAGCPYTEYSWCHTSACVTNACGCIC